MLLMRTKKYWADWQRTQRGFYWANIGSILQRTSWLQFS